MPKRSLASTSLSLPSYVNGLTQHKISLKRMDTATLSSEENAVYQMYSAQIKELLRTKLEAELTHLFSPSPPMSISLEQLIPQMRYKEWDWTPRFSCSYMTPSWPACTTMLWSNSVLHLSNVPKKNVDAVFLASLSA